MNTNRDNYNKAKEAYSVAEKAYLVAKETFEDASNDLKIAYEALYSPSLPHPLAAAFNAATRREEI